MPQDPNLYGQRPVKKQKREIPLSSSLAFTSQLSSLISAPTTTSSGCGASSSFSSGRPRPSKTKDDIFSIKAKRKPGATTKAFDNEDDNAGSNNIRLKHVHNTEEEKQDFARARRKMEEKARLYAAMKRGDYVAKENEAAPLVDFDRKWAERHPEDDDDDNNRYSSSGSDNESSDDNDDDDDQEMVEYQDEFGRTRAGTRAEAQRQERRVARAALGAAELDAMAAVPTARPRNLIFGDAIQTGAFAPEDATLDAMAALAARRDREPTPPPDTHFDGGAEIRTRGTGFYQFSREAEARAREMGDLRAAREETERVRRSGRERDEDEDKDKERRRREIEERRAEIGRRRAEKMADHFLDGLAGEMGIAAGRTRKGDGDKGDEGKHGGGGAGGGGGGSKPVSAGADA
ncbi:hypothetical protein F5B21DRAFT_415315 [Xylaria acuta]|nr:hypothetical protein F5B21DRAFT_415315 [Xylaria acuta]